MPKKSKEVEEEEVILGRISGNLKAGIVGLPNVGKSSFFNLLCKMSVPAENYPFCTIEPSVSRVFVPDERFDWLVDLYKPKSVVPAHVTVTDIAGLVRGASKGEGLGNAFLSNIAAVDGIFHMVRAFEDTDITHVEESVDPIRDLDIIEEELIAKDLVAVDKLVATMQNIVDKVDKKRKPELDCYLKCQSMLNEGKQIRNAVWKGHDIDYINPHNFLTAKPAMYLVNLSERDFLRKKNKWLVKIKQWIDEHGGGVIIPFSVAFEAKIFDMPEDEAAAYCKEVNGTTAMPKIIRAGFTTLNLASFFTCGPDEVRSWTIRRGYKAPQAAGVIHSDFEKGFICCETMAYEHLKEAGTEAACKAAGHYNQQGKNYVVKDGDICHFQHGTITKSKK